jgi:hypothetical protein
MPITDSARIQATTIRQHRTKNRQQKEKKQENKKSKSAKAI